MREVAQISRPAAQLQMVWPPTRPAPPLRVHAGYYVRTYQPGDIDPFCQVMDLAGFTGWTEEMLRPWLNMVIPDGWFMAVHAATEQIAATAMTTHNPTPLHPFGGELGWVAGHPAHTGKGLGWSVCAAVTLRYLRAGYHNIYLKTDDFRLPAIKIYLRLGYVPLLYLPEMAERWRVICGQLGWEYTPDDWPADNTLEVWRQGTVTPTAG
jgi:mycothiol synthase